MMTTTDVDAATLLSLYNALEQAGFTAGLSRPVDPRHVDWTYQKFLEHMAVVQKLRVRSLQGQESTALKRARNIRRLERMGVSLRPPSEQAWIEHVAFLLEQDASGAALNQYRKAMRSLLRFLGLPVWECLRTGYAETPREWTLPPDELVPRFWDTPRHDVPYLQEMGRAALLFGFGVGPRPPSEYAALSLGDIEWDARVIVVTEVKKGGRRLPIYDIPEWALAGLWEYQQAIRPTVDLGETDAFFLTRTGLRWFPQNLGTLLADLGRQVWPEFEPYTARRWAVTDHLIRTGDIYATADRFGDKVATIEKHYLDRVRIREARRRAGRVPHEAHDEE